MGAWDGGARTTAVSFAAGATATPLRFRYGPPDPHARPHPTVLLLRCLPAHLLEVATHAGRLAVAATDHTIAILAEPDLAVAAGTGADVLAGPRAVLRGHTGYVNDVAFSVAAGWTGLLASGSGPFRPAVQAEQTHAATWS